MRRFLIVGQTGVGKSSFVNATFGMKKAQTDEFEACTKVVEDYREQTLYGNVCLIDTPGLAEDTKERDRAYLQLVQEFLVQKPVDVTLSITPLNDTRFRREEMETLKVLTTQLGSSIWQNAWIVFTFAASVPAEQFEMSVNKKLEPISLFLARLVKEGGGSFRGFQAILGVDNLVPNWHKDAVSIASVLTFKT